MRHLLLGIPNLARGLLSCCLALVVVALLVGVGACSAALVGLGHAWAAPAPDPAGLDVVLVIDQSQSLYDLGGTGSDPGGLRQQGARLFAQYLGAGPAAPASRLGLVYFGTTARLALPLTPLDGAGRAAAMAALDTPPAMGWTDVSAALIAASQAFENQADPGRRRALVLFTDGRPQTDWLGSPAAESAYLGALRDHVGGLTGGDITVFVLLLRNAATDADPYLRQTYRPFWIGLAESNPRVRFYDLRQGADLPPTYHAIVAGLSGHEGAGTVLNGPVTGAVEAAVTVRPGWESATFVIHKSSPAIQVHLARPDGTELAQPGATLTDSDHEVWSVSAPAPGTWTVRATGQGAVTVWLDYRLAPATAPPVATAPPSATAPPTPSATPAPPPAPPRAGGGGWLAALALAAGGVALVLATGTAAHLAGRRRHGYALGSLRLRSAPAGSALPPVIDLSAFHAASVSLGHGPGCDLALPCDPPPPARVARISLDTQSGDGRVTLEILDATATVLVNGHPLAASAELFDRDTIQMGAYALGYENPLRRRPPAHH